MFEQCLVKVRILGKSAEICTQSNMDERPIAGVVVRVNAMHSHIHATSIFFSPDIHMTTAAAAATAANTRAQNNHRFAVVKQSDIIRAMEKTSA